MGELLRSPRERVSYIRVMIAWQANVKTSQSYGYETHLDESSNRMSNLLKSPCERVLYLAYQTYLFGTKGLVR